MRILIRGGSRIPTLCSVFLPCVKDGRRLDAQSICAVHLQTTRVHATGGFLQALGKSWVTRRLRQLELRMERARLMPPRSQRTTLVRRLFELDTFLGSCGRQTRDLPSEDKAPSSGGLVPDTPAQNFWRFVRSEVQAVMTR